MLRLPCPWYNNPVSAHSSSAAKNAPSVSVVVPIYNEAKSLPTLFARLIPVLEKLPESYEVVAVDDGSTDDSFSVLQSEAHKNPHIRTLRFPRNFGQTAALSAGIEHAHGNVIVTIDSDLENDPADIPKLLATLDDTYSVVSGWRERRWEGSFVTRKIPSLAANWLISALTGVKLHDYGCTLKAYRASVIKGVRLYGEMHRFIPAYAAWQGGRVTEIPVNYAPRMHGKSNYGLGRIFRVLLDLVVVVFMHRYLSRPMHFFGGTGLVSLLLGGTVGLIAIVLKIFHIRDFVSTPLPILAALLIIVGVQLILFGVIGEMLMRLYYESGDRRPYVIAEISGE